MIEEKEDPKLLRTYKGHKESVLSVAYNPQGYTQSYVEGRLPLGPWMPQCVFGTLMERGI